MSLQRLQNNKSPPINEGVPARQLPVDGCWHLAQEFN